jgi:hypothetical protein
MYSIEELEYAKDMFKEVGWKVIEKHINEEIKCLTDKLIDSNEMEDEKLKGRILALKNDVLTLPETFKQLHKDMVTKIKEKEGDEKK